jgi:hypothetical protein
VERGVRELILFLGYASARTLRCTHTFGRPRTRMLLRLPALFRAPRMLLLLLCLCVMLLRLLACWPAHVLRAPRLLLLRLHRRAYA